MRRYTTLWITNVVNRRCRSLAEMWATRDLAYDRQQPWKENQVKSGTILAPPGLGGGIPPGYMPRINTGLGFIDLNPRLEKYHTSVYSAIFKSRLSPLANNWNSCKRFCFNILFFAASEAILLIFQCERNCITKPNENDINQRQFWAASVSFLAGLSLNTSNQDRHENNLNNTLLCYLV